MKEIVQSPLFSDSNALIHFEHIKQWRKLETEEICDGMTRREAELTLSTGERGEDVSSAQARGLPWGSQGLVWELGKCSLQ